jgi:sugar phosphate permease
MIIEGLPTLVLGIATWWWLADEPESAYYLSKEEKALVMVRKERQIGYSKSGDHFHKEDMILAFKDWKVWVICIGQFGADAVLYGYSTFLPTIIKGLGKWTTAQSQALTVPCYAVGAICYLLVARLSDHQQRRGLYATIFGVICVVGYGILISKSSPGVHFFGCFVVAAGLYAIVGIPLSWLPSSKSATFLLEQYTLGKSMSAVERRLGLTACRSTTLRQANNRLGHAIDDWKCCRRYGAVRKLEMLTQH